MKHTALVIQGMAGFDAFLAGVLQRLEEEKITPEAITTEGASISPTIWFSAGLPMADYLEKIKKLHWYATPPQMVFTGAYTNGYFHSTNSMDIAIESLKGKSASLYTYHYYPDEEKEDKIHKAMRFPVYSGIINLESGEHKVKNLQDFSSTRYYRWLGGRIPYFTPTEIDGETFVEDYYRNPPLKPIMKNKSIKKLIFIRSFLKQDEPPKNYLELQDRDIAFTMNSYFNREIEFLEKVNRWVRQGKLSKEEFRIIEKSSIAIETAPLDYLDFTPAALEKKYQMGLDKGLELLKDLQKDEKMI